ncbi:hypothetical protein AVEN_47767-1, partial [Araneus ventricosus]
SGSFKRALKPVTISKPFDPDDLYNQLACACIKGCGSTLAAEKPTCVSIALGNQA